MGTAITGGMTSAGFYKPIDYSIGAGSYSQSFVVDQYGKVWSAGSNTSGSLGWGSTSTYPASSQYNYFRTVATSGTSGATYLPTNYQAVAVSSGGNNNANLILTSTGALYGAGYSSHLGGASTTTGTFTRIDGVTSLPEATASNPIIDFAGGGQTAAYVLYKDGSLYRGYDSKWTKTNPSGVTFTMFDIDGWYSNSAYGAYAVSTDNKIYYTTTTGTTELLYSPVLTTGETIIQVASCNSSWGYLTSKNILSLSNTSHSSVPTSSNGTPGGTTFYQFSNVTYFDVSHGGYDSSYGIIQNGVTKLWGTGSYGHLGSGGTSDKTFSSSSTPSVDTTYMPEPLDRDISNTPPAIFFCNLNYAPIIY